MTTKQQCLSKMRLHAPLNKKHKTQLQSALARLGSDVLQRPG